MSRVRCGWSWLAMAGVVCGVLAGGVAATPEDLDTAFGIDGLVRVAEPDSWADPVRVLRDRRLLVVAQRSASPQRGLWRYDPDGRIDPTFGGGDGHVATQELCALPSCRIVDLAASAETIHVLLSSNQVVRLLADGTIDRRFGLDGYAAAPVENMEVRSLAIDGRGRVVTLGHTVAPAGEGIAYRLLPDGSLDTSFGTETAHPGVVALGPGEVGPMIVDADGSLTWLTYGSDKRMSRLLPEGKPDPAFNPVWPPRFGGGAAMLRDSRGRIIVGASELLGYPRLRPSVLAFLADGTMDTTFGAGGVARIPTEVPGEDGTVYGIAEDDEHRIVAVGDVGRAGNTPYVAWIPRALVARLLPDGTPDTQFAPAGSVSLRFGLGTGATGVVVADRGRIVVAGGVLERIFYSGKYALSEYRAVLFALQGGSTTYARPDHESVAVEYFHRQYGHYFVSAGVDETRRLDTDAAWTSQWSRTGHAFNVWTVPDGDHVPVCRFWSGQSFAPRSSHFYTPYAGECARVGLDPVWQFEGNAFAWKLPIWGLLGASCPADARPLYRAYNRGASGAPNHRYTTDAAVLDEMIGQGWEMEGDRWTRVFACVPRHD